MRKSMLLATATGYRPSIRLGKHGHPMRDEGGSAAHQGGTQVPGGVSGAGGQPQGQSQPQQFDNRNGNQGTGGTDSSQPNNGGHGIDLSKFWASPEGEGNGSPARESAGPRDSTSGQPQGQGEPQTPAQRLMADIQGLDFKNFGMNDAIIAELADGKTDTFNANINQMGQAAVQNAIRLMVPLMGQMRDQMRDEIKSELQGNNKSRDNEAALTKAFTAYGDPKARPIIERTFEQALRHTSGDQTKAIALTRDMLKISMESMGSDIGIPPRSAGDFGGSRSGSTNWLDELAGR